MNGEKVNIGQVVSGLAVILGAVAVLAGVVMVFVGIWGNWRWVPTGGFTIVLGIVVAVLAAAVVDR